MAATRSETHRDVIRGQQGNGRRVTVVNDNPDFLALLHDVLTADGYAVTVIDGDHITSVTPIVASEPELLIIDLRLASDGLKGWSLLTEAIRSGALAEVPIIICTAAIAEVRARAESIAELPNVEVLTKPFDLVELEALLGKLLG